MQEQRADVTSSADAQFRRGMLAESTEILLYPHQAPAEGILGMNAELYRRLT